MTDVVHDGSSTTESPTASDSPHSAVEPDHSGRNRLVINLMLVSAFVVILNETIMGVAIPRLMRDLRIDASSAQWLSTAFMLTMAIVIPITGFLLQRFNTRPVFIAAMSLFSLGTLTAAMAPGFAVLLAARVVQASGTAIMFPLLMTTVMTLVPPATRGRTMGNISTVISVAPAIGPMISGIILSVLDWRWMFILVLPIAVTMLMVGAVRVQNVTTPRPVPIDSLSVVLSALGFGGLIYGLSSLGEAAAGHAAVQPWMPLAVGSVSLAGFVLRQLRLQRDDRALLDLRTFKSSGFTISLALMAILMMAMFGTIILLPIYLQNVLGLDPLATGLLLLPGGLLMGLLAPFVGRIYDRRGPRILLIPGSVVVSGALWSLTLVGSTTPYLLVLACHVALSIGLALMFTPLFTSALGSVKPQYYSHGSAMIGTVQQLAGAAGTAMFVTVLTGTSVGLAAAGATPALATAGGVHAAFVCGAVISIAAIVGSVFVTKPPAEGASATQNAAAVAVSD